jgi:hypothetical protein
MAYKEIYQSTKPVYSGPVLPGQSQKRYSETGNANFIGPLLSETTKPSSSSSTKKKSSNSSNKSSSSKSSAPAAPVDPMDIFAQQEGMATDVYKQNLSDSLLALDKNKALAEQQIGSLESQKKTDQSILEQALKSVLTQAGTTKENLMNQAEAATEQGASAARQATTKTRNTLRGLGILSSSAAGELLSRPGTEFQKVSADVQTQLSQGIKQIDDFVTSKTEENALKVQQLLQQYTDLIGRIQTDLRFSDRERLSAVKQANLARDQMLSEIRANQTNYQLQAQTLKNNLLSGATSTFGTATTNLGAAAEGNNNIQGTTFTPQNTKVSTDIYTQRKKLSDLMGGAVASYGN